MALSIDLEDMNSISREEIISFTMVVESIFAGLALIVFFLIFIL